MARRVLLSSIIGRLALPPDARILEIGLRTGGNLEMLSAFGRISALDMDATHPCRVLPHRYPFSGEKFDLVCLFEVLEHIEEDFTTLVAIRELVAGGGKILITVPAYQRLWSKHDEFLHHKRRYSARDLQHKIDTAALRVKKLSFFNTLLFPLAVTARFKGRLLGAASANGSNSCRSNQRLVISDIQ